MKCSRTSTTAGELFANERISSKHVADRGNIRFNPATGHMQVCVSLLASRSRTSGGFVPALWT